MSITKTGIWTSNNFYESGYAQWSDPTISSEYAPVKDTSNSCQNNQTIRFTDIPTTQATDVKIRIELDVFWSGGFDTSSTAGTFDMYFQGAQYIISSSSIAWQGTNYITSILNNTQSLKTLVISAASGSYHYNCTTTIPASWFATYNGSNLGIRTNYANNGTAKVEIKNVKIYPDKYYCAETAHVANNYIAGYQFYEI